MLRFTESKKSSFHEGIKIAQNL